MRTMKQVLSSMQHNQLPALETGLGQVRPDYGYTWSLCEDNTDSRSERFDAESTIIAGLQKLYKISGGLFHNRFRRFANLGTGTREMG